MGKDKKRKETKNKLTSAESELETSAEEFRKYTPRTERRASEQSEQSHSSMPSQPVALQSIAEQIEPVDMEAHAHGVLLQTPTKPFKKPRSESPDRFNISTPFANPHQASHVQPPALPPMPGTQPAALAPQTTSTTILSTQLDPTPASASSTLTSAEPVIQERPTGHAASAQPSQDDLEDIEMERPACAPTLTAEQETRSLVLKIQLQEAKIRKLEETLTEQAKQREGTATVLAQRTVELFSPHIEQHLETRLAPLEQRVEVAESYIKGMQEQFLNLLFQGNHAETQAYIKEKQQASREIVVARIPQHMTRTAVAEWLHWFVEQAGFQRWQYALNFSGPLAVITMHETHQRGRLIGSHKHKPWVIEHAGKKHELQLRAQLAPTEKLLQLPLRTTLTALHTAGADDTKQYAKQLQTDWDCLRLFTVESDKRCIQMQLVYTKTPTRALNIYVSNELSVHLPSDLISRFSEYRAPNSVAQYAKAETNYIFPYEAAIKPMQQLRVEHPAIFTLSQKDDEQKTTKGTADVPMESANPTEGTSTSSMQPPKPPPPVRSRTYKPDSRWKDSEWSANQGWWDNKKKW